jgi:MoxR-like ATPase
MNFKETMLALQMFNPRQSIMLMGNHGIGKSDCVRLAAKYMGLPCIDIRLSQCDVGDLKGMPFNVRGQTYFAPPDFYPLRKEDAEELSVFTGQDVRAGAPAGFLFLDEINRASREVQQAAFEIVLDHRLNQRHLPDGWRVVAAINDDDDLYSVIELDPAFIDRYFVIKFRPTVTEFMEWGKEDNNLHPAIYEFLQKYPSFVDPTKEIIKQARANKVHGRRSWAHFSRTLYTAEESKSSFGMDILDRKKESLDFLFLIAQGHVGSTAAVQFKQFVETDYQALNAEIILNKWDDTIASKIQEVVDANRIPELAAYNGMLNEYVKDHIKKGLTEKQSENLLAYVTLVPNEVCADFWKKFNSECSDVSQRWYQNSKVALQVKKRIIGVLANPETIKEAAAKAAASAK